MLADEFGTWIEIRCPSIIQADIFPCSSDLGEQHPKAVLNGLRNQGLDISVMVMLDDTQDIELKPLCQTRWYMLMSVSHPLAQRSVLDIYDLAGQRIVLADNEIATRTHINAALEGMEMPAFIGVDDFIFDLIGQQIEGEGAMMLSTEVVLGMFNPQFFVMVPLEGDSWRTQLYIARRQNTAHTPRRKSVIPVFN